MPIKTTWLAAAEIPCIQPCAPPLLHPQQGVTSPLAGQMLFRASLFGAFGESKRWLAKNPDGTSRALRPADFYKVWGWAEWEGRGRGVGCSCGTSVAAC